MKKLLIVCVTVMAFVSCEDNKVTPGKHASVNNTAWMVSITVAGNTSTYTQNIFDFSNKGAYFAWHIAAGPSYTGTWTQDDETVRFTFKVTTANVDDYWESTGTLSDDDTVLTGTMQKRGTENSGTFTAIKP